MTETMDSKAHILIEDLRLYARRETAWDQINDNFDLAMDHKFVVHGPDLMEPSLREFGKSLVDRKLFRMPFEYCLVEIHNLTHLLEEEPQGTIVFMHVEQAIGYGRTINSDKPEGAFVERAADDVQIAVQLYTLFKDERGWIVRCAPGTLFLDMSSNSRTDFDHVMMPEGCDDRWQLDSGHAAHVTEIMIFAFVSLINSKSAIFETREAPEKLNKRRIARGREPLHSYRIVRLPTREQQQASDHHGERASPRLHWRRGHFRRWKEGVIPVSPCLVGSEESGTVSHLYRVARKADADAELA